MTKIWAVTYAEHVKFQPEPANTGTRKNPGATEEQPPVDTWRNAAKLLVADSAQQAIARAEEIAKQDPNVTEITVASVVLHSEAE